MMRRNCCGGGSLGVSSFLFTRFDRHVMPHGASGDGAKHGMVMRIMTGYTADNSAFKATCLGRHGGACNHERRKHSGNLIRHPILRF